MLGVLSWFASCRRAFSPAILSSVLLLDAAGLAWAQSSDEEPDWVMDTWQTDAGLPNNSVTALAQTLDGYLWVGTSNGLARFDGLRFTTFRTLDNPELMSNRILCLHEDRRGGLWIGTDQGGLARYREGRFSAFTTAEGLSANAVLCLGTDENEALWVGTPSGLNRRASGQWTSFFQTDGLPDDTVSAICQPRNAPLIFASGKGLCRYIGERLVGWQAPAWTQMAGTISRLYEDRQGRLWVAGEQGVWRLSGAAVRASGPAVRIWPGKVLTLLERKDGEIWFGTAEGDLCRVTPGLADAGVKRVLGFAGPVTALCEDGEGNLWVGTSKDGLHRLKRRQLRCIPFADSQEGTAPPCLFETPTGELEFVTADCGLYHFQDGRFTLSERLPLPSGLVLRTVCSTRGGELWIGTAGEGLFRCRGGSVERFSERDGLSGNSIEVLCADDEDGLWIGTRNGGLNCLKDRAIKRFNTPWGFTGNFACCLAKDQQGTLWIGTTGDGLFQLKQGQFLAFTETSGLPSGDVRSLCVEPDGVLWVGTDRGLCRLKEGRVSTCTGRTALPGDAVWQLRSDAESNLWVGSSSSILRVRKEQLNAYAEEQTPILDAVPYGREDGLPGLQCLPAALSQPSRGAPGGLWFSTTRGLVVPAGRQLHWNNLQPPVVLEQVLIENEPVPLTEPIQVPPGKESLQFRYTALSFAAPGKVAFRYRLEGFDRDWSEVTPSHTARYPKIPPGSYRFQVVARNNDGLWNEVGARVAVSVLPFWWATNWFRAAGAAAVLALLGGLYRLRLARRRELERLRVRIAGDLHDDIGSSLWSITLLSRLLAQSATLGTEERHDVTEINRIAVQTSNSIRDIIWLINPAFDSLQDLVLRTKDFAGTALRGVEYRLRCEGADLSRKLPLDFRQNLFLLFKEALTNIARHAQATIVEIEVQEHPGGWRFSIRDNGVGFDPAATTSGNGLKNLRARARKMGATLEIQSQPGRGATLVFTTARP